MIISPVLMPDGTLDFWHDVARKLGHTNFTQAEYDEALPEIMAEYERQQYRRDRVVAYPPLSDQFDLIYHSGIAAWKAEINKVKAKYPKPVV